MGQFDFALLGAGGPLMMALDPDGRILLWNRACAELTGYSFRDVRGRDWQSLQAPEDAPALRRAFASLSADSLVRVEGNLIARSGERRWIAWTLGVTRGADDDPEFVIALGINQTEARVAEQALRASEAKFAGIISIAADAIISIDEEQRIVLFNEGAEQIFGWSREEALGKPLDLLLPERFRELHRHHVRRFAADPSKSRRMGERRPALFGLRKNGEEFPAEAAISKLEVDGKLLFTVVLRDVTERDRLYRAAQQAIRVRDETLRIVAHDLRNPLNTARLAAAMLARKLPEDAAGAGLGRMTEVIERSIEQANHLIDDLLDVARSETRTLALDRAQVSAADLVLEAVAQFSLDAAQASIRLVAPLPDELPAVFADRRRVIQVFSNLIGNALKFTPQGGQIRVSAQRRGDEVCFSVADTGPGIPPEVLPRLFDRYSQGRKGAHGGLGLGLQIAKGIVQTHGGHLWAESTVGRGSTFLFTLPVAKEARPEPPPLQAPH